MKTINLNSPEYNIITLDDAIEVLLELKEKGIFANFLFNGCELNSKTITVDSAYKIVTGTTKAEYLQNSQKILSENIKKIEFNQLKFNFYIPKWIKEGEKYIYPQKKEAWKSCVEVRANDIYYGLDIKHALQAMKALDENKSFEEVLDQQG